MQGKIYSIYISESPDKAMQSVSSASLVTGKGIEGDRYFTGKGTFSEKLAGKPSFQVTLIEKEEIDKFNREQGQQQGDGDFRRNIVTTDIRLNDLVDKEFTIGSVKLKGIRLCEPCDYLAKTVNALVLPHLVGRGGLRAQILSSGTVSCGDMIKTGS